MGEIAAIDEHGADEHAPEACGLGDPRQLFEREVHVLQREHGGGEEAARRGGAEVRDPVVIGAGESVGGIGVLDEMEALGEPSGIQKGLVDAHGVHVAEPGLRILSALVDRMNGGWVERAHVVPRHAGAPDGMTWNVPVPRVMDRPAIDLEVRPKAPLFPPQRALA